MYCAEKVSKAKQLIQNVLEHIMRHFYYMLSELCLGLWLKKHFFSEVFFFKTVSLQFAKNCDGRVYWYWIRYNIMLKASENCAGPSGPICTGPDICTMYIVHAHISVNFSLLDWLYVHASYRLNQSQSATSINHSRYLPRDILSEGK